MIKFQLMSIIIWKEMFRNKCFNMQIKQINIPNSIENGNNFIRYDRDLIDGQKQKRPV